MYLFKATAISLAAILFAAPALATGSHSPDPKPTPTPPTTAVGVGIGTGVGIGGGATVTTGPTTVTTGPATATGGKSTAKGGKATASLNSRTTTNVNASSYNQDRRQAPGLAVGFSSGVTAPCEGTAFGLFGTAPGVGGGFQFPNERAWCVAMTQATWLDARGCRNAALAVFAGNSISVALNNNPCGARAASRK